jgi:hypothetical protein
VYYYSSEQRKTNICPHKRCAYPGKGHGKLCSAAVNLIIALHGNSPRSSILHLTTSMATTLERIGASDKTVWPSITGFKVDDSIESEVSPLFDGSEHWMCFSASQQDGRTIMANPSGTYGNEKAMVIIENIMKGIKSWLTTEAYWLPANVGSLRLQSHHSRKTAVTVVSMLCGRCTR